MKKSLRLIISIMMALALIISCSAEPETASGTLKIDVSSSIAKGINPQIDLEAANYRLDVTDSSGNVKSFDIGTMTSAEESFPAGSYSVKAYAENKDGIMIGESEEKSFSIYPNRTTSVSLNITEKAGDGSITISFDGLDVFPDGTTFSVEFMRGIASSTELESAGSFPLETGENGIASVKATLANGFYTFGLKSSDEAGTIALIDSVRIVSGDELSVSYSYSYTGNGEVTITNNIVKTPSIEIEKSGNELPIVLTSTIKNLDGSASYAWYMDGKALSGANGKDLTITAESGIPAGSHEFMLLVISESGIVWSSDALVLSIGGEDANVLNIDASKLDDSLMEINEDTSITISNMDPESLYAIQIDQPNTKSISSKAISGSSKLTKVNDDYFPTSDENGQFKFKGSDINVKEGKIKVINIKEDDDMILDTSKKEEMLYQDDTGYEYYEEFYKINLNKLRQEGIDTSKLIFDRTFIGRGSQSHKKNTWGIFTTHGGIIADELKTRGFIDLSDQSYVKVYSRDAVKPLKEGAYMIHQIIFRNPIPFELEKPLIVKGDVNYLTMEETSQDGTEYYIKITKNADISSSDYRSLWTYSVVKDYEFKSNRKIIPMEETSEHIKIFLGTLEKPSILCVLSNGRLADIGDDTSIGTFELFELSEEEKATYFNTFVLENKQTNTLEVQVNGKEVIRKMYMIDSEELELKMGQTVSASIYDSNHEAFKGKADIFIVATNPNTNGQIRTEIVPDQPYDFSSNPDYVIDYILLDVYEDAVLTFEVTFEK